jgi:hypothetical protein
MRWLTAVSLPAVLAIAALSAPGAVADTCPPGQSGAPPYCVKPPAPPATCEAGQVGTPPSCVTPALTVKAVKASGNAVTITLKVNAPGGVSITGAGVKPKSASAAAGPVTIKAPLTSQAKSTLKKAGKVTLNLKVTYEPTGAPSQTQSLTVVAKKHAGKKRHGNRHSHGHRHGHGG